MTLDRREAYRRTALAMLDGLGGSSPAPGDLEPLDLELVLKNNARGRRVLERLERARERDRERRQREAERRRRCPFFIRFGDAPQTRKSFAGTNKRSPKWEKGVSVFRGWRADDGAYVVDVSRDVAQLEMYKILAQENRPVYLAAGRVIDTGSDLEPVLEAASLELTPLPEGTRVRCSGEGDALTRSAYRKQARLTWGVFSAPAFMREPPKEITVAAPIPVEPFDGDPSTTEGRRGLVDAVLAHSRSQETERHGPDHWKRVAVAGARLAGETPGADPLVVFLFAVLHDSMRIHDFFETWHGWRAANLARDLLSENPAVSEEALETLAYALEEHDAGDTSEDPTVGACWDADRLNLWRVGIVPDPALLSTAAGSALEMRAWAKALRHEDVTWERACGLAAFEVEAPTKENDDEGKAR